jgi:PXPV repeat (3 copies)
MRKPVAMLVVGAALAALSGAAAARSHIDVGINFGIPAPVYVAPAPVYYPPAPVVYAPPPVYYTPAPVYYAPAPVYYGRPYYGRGYGHGRGHGRGHHNGWR